jgi:hypothetical protein
MGISMQSCINMIDAVEKSTGKPMSPIFRDTLITVSFICGQHGYLYGYDDAIKGLPPKVTPEDLINRLANAVEAVERAKDDVRKEKQEFDKINKGEKNGN